MTNNDDLKDGVKEADNVVQPKKSVVRRILKVLAWVIATPLLLVLLLSVLLYVPAVQQWAVGMAGDMLSEQIGMDVRVGEVRLKFPLDFSLKRLTAVAGSDTIADAGEVVASVRLKPLFSKKVEVDEVTLRNVCVDTRDLVEAMRVKGCIGEFYFDSHTTNLADSKAVVSNALLAETDLELWMNDTLAADTTEAAEALEWVVALEDVRMSNVGMRLRLASLGDSVVTGAKVGNAFLAGNLDLGKALYEVHRLQIDGTAVSYDMGDGSPINGALDPNHISLSDIGLEVDSVVFDGKSGRLALALNKLVAKERCGLEIVEGRARVEMDSAAVRLDDFVLRTGASSFRAQADMDFNAFDVTAPGIIGIDAGAKIGWSDIERICGEMVSANDGILVWKSGKKTLPSIDVNLRARGNMKRLNVEKMDASMIGAFSVKGAGVAHNLTVMEKMSGKFGAKADVWDVDFLKGWLPADAASSFNIPKNMRLLANGELDDGVVMADAHLHAADAIVMLTANYGLDTEYYKADVDISNLIVNKIVLMEDEVALAGSVSAEGKGFDFFAKETWTDVTLLLDTALVGIIDLGNTSAHVALENGDFGVEMACDNSQLSTKLDARGHLEQNDVSADIDFDVPYIGLKAMGLSETTLDITTKGRIKATSNLNELFMVDANVQGLDMWVGQEKVQADGFRMYAESMPDSTAANIRVGDLNFEFDSPNNILALLDQFVTFGDMASAQIDSKELDWNALKAEMPVTRLRAGVGQDNPVAKVLKANGLQMEKLAANLNTSPENGVTGWAHMYGLKTDSIEVDTAYFTLVQEDTRLNYKAGVRCDDQKISPGFSVVLDGYMGARDADAHFVYMDKKEQKGLDLGLKAMFSDSLSTFSLYPSEPIIAFSQFAVNDDNYVAIDTLGRIFANVDLRSKTDSSLIALKANPQMDFAQDANAMVKNLDLGELLSVLPFMPKMDGVLNVDANYIQIADNILISSGVEVEKFKYEGVHVGDLKAIMDYSPRGEHVHDVNASLSHNNQEFANFAGVYDGEGSGSLDAGLKLIDLPMTMLAAFIPDQIATLSGDIDGNLKVQGALDKLLVNGSIVPDSVRLKSEPYALNMLFANNPITFENSRLRFNRFAMYGKGTNPLTLNGYVDFSDFEEILMNFNLYGKNFQLIDSKRTRKSIIFGEMYGDFLARVSGTMNDLSVRGMVSVLGNTDMTYVMADTPLSIDYRLEDIVTFVDFSAPPDTSTVREARSFMGMDMNMQLVVEDGAKFNCEFSADRQSYVNVQGGGSMVMTYTPEGVLNLQGRYTINEGEMKYTLPVIPLKTFTLKNGSYIDFTGDPMNPTLNIAATERTKASVSSEDGSSRSVAFDVGLKITNSLSNMGLEFTIEAPEDLTIQNELAGMSLEEKNKLAVAMLATGMYLSDSNSSGFNAGNALNNFLQNEINNIAGRALDTSVNVNVGMEQNTRDDGSTRTDYSFKFSKRFFSDRLNIVIGGKVSSEGNDTGNESGAYIDDVSLEWRLDKGGTRYVRIFHEKNYDNLIEGEMIENGAGVVLRKKLDKLSELFIFKR